MSLHFSLPWPDKALWPNSRVHWRQQRAAAKSYKRAAWFLARSDGARNNPGVTSCHVSLTFHPPTRAKRDLDNMLAAIKHGIDGIALALGIDDSRFEYTIARGEPLKGGSVEVEVETA